MVKLKATGECMISSLGTVTFIAFVLYMAISQTAIHISSICKALHHVLQNNLEHLLFAFK